MDPSTCFETITKLSAKIQEGHSSSDLTEELLEHIDALKGWLSKGGFLPTAWKQSRSKLFEHLYSLATSSSKKGGLQ